MQRCVDTLLGFPPLVLALVIVVALGPSLTHVSMIISLLLLPTVIRISRSAALSAAEEVYVLEAQSIGATAWWILVRHIIPNCLAPVFVVATSAVGSAVLAEASLSFLGLGVPPPQPSWGGMINETLRVGRPEQAPWLAISPGLALTILVFSASMLGDALRDALDPRLRR